MAIIAQPYMNYQTFVGGAKSVFEEPREREDREMGAGGGLSL